tara:strand:- start:531 stop:803 length:273 start_codon:yes stop_codon:yes gene_type:complete
MTTKSSNTNFKEGDIVYERPVKGLKTGRHQFKTSKELNIKQKKGKIVSDCYDEPDKLGRKQPKYKVQWEGRSAPEPVNKCRLVLSLEGVK